MFENYKRNKISVKELFKKICELPCTEGIYIIEVPQDFDVKFLDTTCAPKEYKGKSLLYDKEVLQEKYSNGDRKIVYIGKTNSSKGLRARLGSYLKYGYGQPVAHRGGRAIWQMDNCYDLTVYYCECANAEMVEHKLLNEYKNKYGICPVGNWKC